MEELNRTERFKEASRKLKIFVAKDKKIDPYSGTNQISFRLPNSEHDSDNVFEYSNSDEFIEDLQSLKRSATNEETTEIANRILNNLGIDGNNPFTLEMH